MKIRKMLDGSEATEYEFPVKLEVYTKCPSKYKLIDLETGDEYIGQRPDKKNKFWKKIDA